MRNLLIIIILTLLAGCASEIDNDLDKALDADNIFVGDAKNVDELIDMEAPSGTITINSGDKFTRHRDVKLDISATDTAGVVGYYLSTSGDVPSPISADGWVSVEKTTDYSATASAILPSVDGVKNVSVWYKDIAGNISSKFTDSITYDSTPPSGSITINNGDDSTNKVDVNLELSATDSNGVSDYYLSKVNTAPDASSRWVSIAPNPSFSLSSGYGLKTIYVWYRDVVGNISRGYSDSIMYSSTPPSGSIIINDGDAFTNKANVELKLSATDNNVASYFVSESATTPGSGLPGWKSVGGTPSDSATVSFSLSPANGSKTVYFWYKNGSDDISSRFEDSITYDATEPSGSIIINGGDDLTNSRYITLKLGATDNGSGVNGYYVSENSSDTPTWTPVDSTADYSKKIIFQLSDTDEEKTVYAWYKDAAGNISSVSSDKITLFTSSFEVSYTDKVTSENSGDITLEIRPTQQPSTSIIIELSSSNVNEGTVSSSTSLTFDNTDYDWKSVTVSGEAGDPTSDLAQPYKIQFSPKGIIPDISLYNLDNEYKLPDTDQTTDYTTTHGEDSDYTVNAPSYTVSSNTVEDKNTKLVWGKNGDATGDWNAAKSHCNGLSPNGWRLPTVSELATIVNYGKSSPAIDNTVFSNTSSLSYWSSTNYVIGNTKAWYVNFGDGATGYSLKTATTPGYHVRCVRPDATPAVDRFVGLERHTILDRKTGLIWQQKGDNQEQKWTDAITHCENLTLDGKGNWRLPNIRELGSIVDYGKSSPAIDPKFTSTQSGTDYYWSSTAKKDSTTDAWSIGFEYGAVKAKPKSGNGYTRCVRFKQ